MALLRPVIIRSNRGSRLHYCLDDKTCVTSAWHNVALAEQRQARPGIPYWTLEVSKAPDI